MNYFSLFINFMLISCVCQPLSQGISIIDFLLK